MFLNMKINWGIGTDMTRRVCGTTVALLLLVFVPPVVWSQQYLLYSPKVASPEDIVHAQDGVLVREVFVQKGDTLSGFSQKFSGHGSYYSQILLFNDIKNPNLIYAGKTLRVPVSKKQVNEKRVRVAPAPRKKKTAYPVAAIRKRHVASLHHAKRPVTGKTTAKPRIEKSLGDLKSIDNAKHNEREVKQNNTTTTLVRKPAPVAEVTQLVEAGKEETRSADVKTLSAQKLFESATRSYRQDDCRVALELFERFLSDNPTSPLAADASLYKAECYLKLSSQ